MLTRKTRILFGDANSTDLDKTVTLTADGSDDRSVAVAETTDDVEVAISFDKDLVKVLVIFSDQDVTIETNSGSAPDDTLTIKANVPLVWYENCGLPAVFSADVTKLFISNAGATAATVDIRVLMDSTP